MNIVQTIRKKWREKYVNVLRPNWPKRPMDRGRHCDSALWNRDEYFGQCDQKKRPVFFWVIPTLLMKSLSNQKVQKNKLALKSEMKGSFLCELFDLTNFLLIKLESPKKSRVSFSDRIGQIIHPWFVMAAIHLC